MQAIIRENDIQIKKVEATRLGEVDLENVQFGRTFTDHMFSADYSDGNWVNLKIEPFGPLAMNPATAILHYGQGIFEGMKAFRDASGKVQVFRPEMNMRRLNYSAQRMAIPEIPEPLFMDALFQWLRLDADWVPHGEDGSLYIRPFVFSTEEFVGIKPGKHFKFMIIGSPVGKYYSKPVRVYITDKYVRAFTGGTGHIKAIGNYAVTMMPLQEVQEMGYDQILWVDGIHFNKIQEIGTMNVFFVIDNVVITPPTNEFTILSGITRDSCITLLNDKGYQVEERNITVEEIMEAFKNGTLQDAFGTGTAATIAPIGEIGYKNADYTLPDVSQRKVSNWLAHTMRQIRKGELPDTYGWMKAI